MKLMCLHFKAPCSGFKPILRVGLYYVLLCLLYLTLLQDQTVKFPNVHVILLDITIDLLLNVILRLL